MPSDKKEITGLFIPQTVFATGGQAVLMGLLKSGELVLNMETAFRGQAHKLVDLQVFTKHVKSIKAEDKGATGIGLILSNISIEKANEMTGQELLFK